MITANELRIGDWLNIHGSPSPIAIGWFYIIAKKGQLSPHEPILLTQEILGKCGFINNDLPVLEGYVKIRYMFNSFPLVLEIDNSRMPLHNIKSLHQLQNLYFALTSEELIYTP